MIRSYALSFALLLSLFSLQAFQLTSENLREINVCWCTIFDEQLEAQQEDEVTRSRCADLKAMLLDINEADVEIAGQLIVRLGKGNRWDAFIEYKSYDTTVAYLELLNKGLQEFIGDDCQLNFPPKLDAVDKHMRTITSDEMEAIAKIRQAFLTFTIIVSKMDYLARQ